MTYNWYSFPDTNLGRSKLDGTARARLKFICPVPSCHGTFRTDHLKSQHLNSIIFDGAGLPINPSSVEFSKLIQRKKEHTSESNLHPLWKPISNEASVASVRSCKFVWGLLLLFRVNNKVSSYFIDSAQWICIDINGEGY